MAVSTHPLLLSTGNPKFFHLLTSLLRLKWKMPKSPSCIPPFRFARGDILGLCILEGWFFNRFYTWFVSINTFKEFLFVAISNLLKCFASFIVGVCIEIPIPIRFHIDYSTIVVSPFLLPAGVLCLINFQLFGPKNYCHHRMQLFINYRLRAKKPPLWKVCTKRHLIVNSKPIKKSMDLLGQFQSSNV